MRRVLGTLAAFVVSVTPISAIAGDAPSALHLAAATTLIEKLQMERSLDQMFVNLKGMFAENVIATMLRDDSNGSSKRFFDSIPGGRDRFADILGEEFVTSLRRHYPDFKKTASDEYAKAFTLEELNSLNAFFASGAGEKWLALAPQMEKTMGEWGEKAGMQAGAEAVTAAIARAQKMPSNEGAAK